MKNILKFNDHDDFLNKTQGSDKLVSMCVQDLDTHVHYGQDTDYINECFSIKILSGSNATIELHYDPDLGSNSVFVATVPVSCDSAAGTINHNDAGSNYTQYEGDNGVISITGLNAGDQLWFYQTGDWSVWTETVDETDVQHGAIEFNMDGCTVSLQGNIMSLIATDNEDLVTPTQNFTQTYIFYHMFYEQPVVYANNLILPLKTLPGYACHEMFKGCTELKTIPQLPATSIGAGCYYEIFSGCTSLEDISYLKLPYMTIPSSGWRAMFYQCTGLKKAMSVLRFTQNRDSTTAYYNCSSMFAGCTSLIEAPALYVGNTGARGLQYMFSGCTSLTTAPVLEITGYVYNYACYYMFNECTKLVNVFPELVFTVRNQYNFREMFLNCKSLVKAPKLTPRSGDINTGTGYNCYHMFYGCSKLNYLDVSAVTVAQESHVTQAWLSGVASTGTFVTVDKTLWSAGTGGIPSGWTAVDPNGNPL